MESEAWRLRQTSGYQFEGWIPSCLRRQLYVASTRKMRTDKNESESSLVENMSIDDRVLTTSRGYLMVGTVPGTSATVVSTWLGLVSARRY
jgi:hypothetical protein